MSGGESLAAPKAYALDRFGAKEHRLNWISFIFYDGALYDLQAHPQVSNLLASISLNSKVQESIETLYPWKEAIFASRRKRKGILLDR